MECNTLLLSAVMLLFVNYVLLSTRISYSCMSHTKFEIVHAQHHRTRQAAATCMPITSYYLLHVYSLLLLLHSPHKTQVTHGANTQLKITLPSQIASYKVYTWMTSGLQPSVRLLDETESDSTALLPTEQIKLRTLMVQ